MAITKVVPICLDISSEILDPHMEPLRKRQTGCFSMNYWFALHIPHIWLANSLECFFTFSFFSLPSFSVVSGRVSLTNILNYTNTFVPKGQLISKANCQGRGFSQKTNENTSHTSKNEFIRSFFGRILGQKKTFRDYLTFS